MDAIIEVMTSPDGPWWGDGVIGLLGGLVGAGIALLGARASDRWKAKDEDRRRWDDEIVELSVELLDHAGSLTKFSNLFSQLLKADRKDWLTDIRERVAAIGRIVPRLRLIAPDLYEPAQQVVQAGQKLVEAEQGTLQDFQAAAQEFDKKRDKYVKACQKVLRVK